MSHDRREPPTLVGRRQQLAELEGTLGKATAGTPSVVVVMGESGVGKSTLLDAFVASADATTLTGGCVPVAGEQMPFTPFVAAMRGLANEMSTPDRRAFVARWPAVFTSLLPGDPVTAEIDQGRDASTGDDEASGSTMVSDTGQIRLFESLLSLLTELAAERPVVWVVEDLHWADRSTLDLIAYLARNLGSEPVLLALTVRSDDLHRDSPLRSWLAELLRIPIASRIEVSRLDRTATDQQIRRLTGSDRPPDSALVDRVFDRSAGNPLFTEHLLPWTREDEKRLPDTLQEIVTARFAALPQSTKDVLGVAAIIGHRSSLDLLGIVVDKPIDEVETLLRPAVDRQVVRPRDDATYSFGHPIYREVLESELLPGTRRSLHRATAQALVERGASTRIGTFDLTRIAYHWDKAGVPDVAYAAAVEAGLAAEKVFAFAEADEHFRRALELEADAAPEPASTSVLDRTGLLVHASQAAHLTGDGPRAVELIGQAVAVTDEPARRSEVLERKGVYCVLAGMPDEADRAYAEALSLLDPEPTPALARVHAGIGILAMAWSRMDEAEAACRTAIDTARIVGSKREEGRALNALGVVTAYRGEFDTAIEFSRQSVQIAEELADPDGLADAYIDLAHVLGLAGRYEQAAEVSDQGYAALRKVGLVRQDGSFLQANGAESLIKAGQFSRAQDLLQVAIDQRARGVRSFPVLLQKARLCLWTGDVEAAREWIDRVTQVLGDFGVPDAWWRELHELDAEAMAWERRPRPAYEQALAGLDLAATGDEQRFAGPLVSIAARALADMRDDAHTNKVELARLERERESLIDRASSIDPTPLEPNAVLYEAAAVAATIAAELARFDRAADLADRWHEAAAQWESIGQPFRAAYAAWREAETLVVGKKSGARTVAAVRHAHQIAYALGAEGLAAEAMQLARWGRIDVHAGEPAEPAEDDAAALVDFELTARESEVLAGLVAGRTNKEIATSLFISVKTASVHVSNILHKMNVSTREEAARIGHQRHVPPAT